LLDVKQQGSETDSSPPSGGEVRNERSYTSTPPVSLHGMHMDDFNFVSNKGIPA
jgi:hypothetical protein